MSVAREREGKGLEGGGIGEGFQRVSYSHQILEIVSGSGEFYGGNGVYKPFRITAIFLPCCSFRM